MHSLGLREPLHEAEPLLKQDLSHGELDKHKFKKLGGTFVVSNRKMTKWRSAGAYCYFLFFFLTLIYSSLATHDKDFLKRNQKRRPTSVECPLSNTTYWRGFPSVEFKKILFFFTFKGWDFNDKTIWNMGLLIYDLDHGDRQLRLCAQLWVVLISMSHLLCFFYDDFDLLWLHLS